jgi:hypothetical protein
MIGVNALLMAADGAAPAAALAALAADFDGTNDHMARNAALTGAVAGGVGLVSFWLRLDGGDAATNTVLYGDNSGSIRLQVLRNASNKFQVQGRNSSNSIILSMVSSGTYTAGASWIHVLMSWRLSTGTGQLYINDVADLAASPTLTSGSVQLNCNNWTCGAPVGLSSRLNGALAELYLAPTYLDLSVESNRRKFSTADGKPADLGANGSTPTGSAPLIYLSLRSGDAVTDFATNRGGGGNFGITGTLDLVTPSPWA